MTDGGIRETASLAEPRANAKDAFFKWLEALAEQTAGLGGRSEHPFFAMRKAFDALMRGPLTDALRQSFSGDATLRRFEEQWLAAGDGCRNLCLDNLLYEITFRFAEGL